MANYLVIDGDWLEGAIRQAESLRENAQSTGKPVAIAAAGIRLESLKQIRDLAVPARDAGQGEIALSIERPPASE